MTAGLYLISAMIDRFENLRHTVWRHHFCHAVPLPLEIHKCSLREIALSDETLSSQRTAGFRTGLIRKFSGYSREYFHKKQQETGVISDPLLFFN